jgi:hypothetical protein
MGTTVEGWTTLTESPLVLLREYSFGPGRANALAVRLPSGKFLIASAPIDAAEPAGRALAAHGDVTALLAVNGAHYLGLKAARAAFPDAVSYAHPNARERILKQAEEPGPLRPITELTPQLGDQIEVLAIDGCKIGDVLVRVRTERGTLLYTTDFIANIPKLPANPIFKLIFKFTDSGPGFKVFRIFFMFYASNKRAARDHLIREIEANPPSIVVPAHGAVVEQPNLGPELVSMLRAAF